MERETNPGRSWFCTLTYSDETIPRTVDGVPTLHRRGFQDWFEQANRDAGRVRYYAVSEYGENTLRPHHHLALFPEQDSQADHILRAWQRDHGFTQVAELTHERARYLANYTAKKLTKDTDERLEPGQEPEFRSSSTRPGLGAAFVPLVVSVYRGRAGQKIIDERGDVERTVRIGGKVYPIPRYILQKVRAELGIPLKHEDRLHHPGYGVWNDGEFASFDPVAAALEAAKHAAKKTQRRFRSTTERI